LASAPISGIADLDGSTRFGDEDSLRDCPSVG